jgi:hypothetical protein
VTINLDDISDRWWKAHMDPSWTKLLGTGVGEQLRNYESALKVLKDGKVPLPPVDGFTANRLKNYSGDRSAMSKAAAKAWKALFEVEKKLADLEKKGPWTKLMNEWSLVVYRQKQDLMNASDGLK